MEQDHTAGGEVAVSLVLPVRNERGNLAPLLREIVDDLGDLPYEIIAVDDASDDGSFQELKRLATLHRGVRIVPLSKRSGQSAALAAGFAAAQGDLIVTLDADGQMSPTPVPRMIELLRSGQYDAVVGYRRTRASGRWKSLQSRVANTVRNWITGDRVRDTGCSLRAIRRPILRDVPRFDGMHRFLPTLIRMAGGHVLEIPVVERPRGHGRSKYGVRNRLFVGLRDAFRVRRMRRRKTAAHAPRNSE